MTSANHQIHTDEAHNNSMHFNMLLLWTFLLLLHLFIQTSCLIL